jgi:hypothetical protein
MTIYGHLHLNCFFVNLLELTDSGLIYKGKQYSWSDIVKIKRTYDSMILTILMYGRKYPGATIILKDGSKIRINCRVFTRKGESIKVGFAGFFTQESKAFTEFMQTIENKMHKEI